jgi:hemolysin III
VSERAQSVGEERANCVSHAAALLAAMLALPWLLRSCAESQPGHATLIGVSGFAATLLLLYLASALYHGLPDGRSKCFFLRLDHGAIYLFIAGSYTPFAMSSLDQPGVATMLTLVWVMASAGFVLKLCGRLAHAWLSTSLYLAMGWLVLIAAAPLIERVPTASAAWLIYGGVAYTVGVAFFALDSRLRYAHAVWHGFVVVGTGCHFVAVLGFTR